VVLGFKHTRPTIEDGVAELAARGIDTVVAVVLAPHFSALSVGEYLERADAASAEMGLTVHGIRSWHLERSYIDFLAAAVRTGLSGLPHNTKVVFTAHSLPQRILATGDPYPDEVFATAQAVARAAGLAPWAGWGVAWQSAGRTPEPWIGPDLLTVIDELAPSENADGVLVCACGFVSDHLEVLYDLDIAARAHAEKLGLAFGRTPCVNDDPTVMRGLAGLVVAAARTAAASA
jgi:ferrochelatase